MIYEPYTREQMRKDWEETMKRVAEERERQARKVNISKLSEGQKRKVWEHLKEVQPGLAALIKDHMLQKAAKLFDADIYLDAEIVTKALERQP